MLKDFLLVRSSDPSTKDRVRNYLQFNHAPLALSVPEIGWSMQRYSMNHVVDDPEVDVCLYVTPQDLATVVEHSLIGGAQKVHEIMADREYQEKVVPDEQHMIDNLMAGMPEFLPIEHEEILFEDSRSSALRMFEFLRPVTGMSPEEFRAKLHEEGAWALGNGKYRASIERRVHSFVGSGPLPVGASSETPARDEEPRFAAVVEVWIKEPEILTLVSDDLAARRGSYVAVEGSLSALTFENIIRG